MPHNAPETLARSVVVDCRAAHFVCDAMLDRFRGEGMPASNEYVSALIDCVAATSVVADRVAAGLPWFPTALELAVDQCERVVDLLAPRSEGQAELCVLVCTACAETVSSLLDAGFER